jgi:nucleoside-diphosphate-sugar epimerase
MKILLSGGSGFIGSKLLKYITQKKNYDILVIGRNFKKIKKENVNFLNFDLNKTEDKFYKIKKFDPDIFLHLAWEGIPDYSINLSKKNYLNTKKIINMLLNETSCQKIISTGSCWEYNDGNLIGECREDQFVTPTKPFSINKNKIFREIYKTCNDKKILFNWLRLFYVYGPGQKKDSIIPLLIDTFRNNKQMKMTLYLLMMWYTYFINLLRIIMTQEFIM